MNIVKAMDFALEGLIAECGDVSFCYLPNEKKYEFSRELKDREYYKQWSVRWPTKKESSIWLKK